MIKKWKKVKTLESYQCGKWYRVDKDKVITPGGKEGIYYVVRRKPAVAIIPIDNSGKIYLTKQYRYTASEYSLEIPSGYMEISEKPLQTAKKELEEEMSLKAKTWTYLGKFNEALGLADIPVYVYIANDAYGITDARKDIHDKHLHKNKVINYKELAKKIAKCEIIDSLTLAALAIAEARGVFNKL